MQDTERVCSIRKKQGWVTWRNGLKAVVLTKMGEGAFADPDATRTLLHECICAKAADRQHGGIVVVLTTGTIRS